MDIENISFFLIVNNIFLDMVVINYISVSGNSTVPTKANAGFAGFDLYSAKTKEIKPWYNASVSTDLKFKIPIDMFGKIFTRSGQFIRDRVTVEGGVIDSDYRGVVNILLFNHSNATVTVGKGQRFAQIVFLKKTSVTFDCVESFGPEPNNERNDSGFGSSGDF